MKTLIRVLTFFVALCVLAGLVLLLALVTQLPWMVRVANLFFSMYPWLPTALAAVILVLMAATLFAIFMIFSIPAGRGRYTIRKNIGKIEISSHCIESAAMNALSGMDGVRHYRAHVAGTPSPKHVKLKLQVEPQPGIDLSTLGEQVQQTVQAGLAETLGMSASNIRVDMRGCLAVEDVPDKYVQMPRVV